MPIYAYLIKIQIDKSQISNMSIWVFPKIGIPQNGCFIMENLIKMDDLGVPLFLETLIYKQRSKNADMTFEIILIKNTWVNWFQLLLWMFFFVVN